MKQSYVALIIGGVVLMGALFLTFRGIFPGAQIAAPGSLNSDVIRIGAALCLTGDCAEWGEGELKSIEMAVDEANASGGVGGKQIKLFIEDMQGTPQGSVNAMQKLITVDHVEAIIGPTWGDSFQAGFTVNNAAQVVAVAPSTALEALALNKQSTEYVFSTWVPIKMEIQALQAYMHRIGVQHVVILHDQDPFGLMIASTFHTLAKSQGIVIADEIEFPIRIDDFRTSIVKLKGMKIDGIVMAFQSAAFKAKFLKQAHELGLAPRLFSTEDIQDVGLLREFGPALEGVVYVYPAASGDVDSFQNKFKSRYGVAPSGASAPNAYDAAQVVIAALKKHEETGIDLRTALENVEIPGAFMKQIKFESHQLTGAEFHIKTIRNGQFVVLQ